MSRSLSTRSRSQRSYAPSPASEAALPFSPLTPAPVTTSVPPPSRLRPPSPPPDASSNILLFLIAFRLVNALTVRTFFQPDEFFQSLEPAWKIAFGESQGPWITWEWKHQLRSSLHPLIFAAVYTVADLVARALGLSPALRADLLIAAPGVTQAVIAAVGDYYTWKLARYIYGDRSYESWATLALTVLSPWQWFCSTRTLSNCLETTITIVALNLWPWEWATEAARARPANVNRIRLCLLLAAFACVLRPTNILIWIYLAGVALHRSTWPEKQTLAREAALSGSAILSLSLIVDRFFYGFWTFPPLRFLYFNIAQSLAVFYGKNDFHYYISQGYPLLLTTALPFALFGLYRTLKGRQAVAERGIVVQLATISLAMPGVLSLITHKEVRFIYPLLPALHILSASPLVDFFLPAVATTNRQYLPRRLTLIFLILVNVVIAVYTTVFHASGVISVLGYLREQHILHGLETTASTGGTDRTYGGITAGFLMPCHSTPWRSHLVEPTIHAWALSCEPPVGLSETEKAAYRDEADQFYDNPNQFLRDHMVGGLRYIPRRPSYVTPPTTPRLPTQPSSPHEWPDYLIFFAQLEPTLKKLLPGAAYGECWRTFNTAWHDDWRRHGDVVVWCLDSAEQEAWRAEKHRREVEERDRQFETIVQAFRKDATSKPSKPWFSWGSPSSEWLWPWQQRKRMTLFGVEVPQWPEWDWPWRKKRSLAGFLAFLRDDLPF
ncbi:Alg9-like mannosyltransferase family-domain-containing protein [Aspergillus pseudodeflectus]|uniref:Mannosyltransferase n=1 Tax=Aspergillus pseudodeflectus TaxID=176178 RepID=A0ABR4LB32_9EURO